MLDKYTYISYILYNFYQRSNPDAETICSADTNPHAEHIVSCILYSSADIIL